MSKQIQDAYVVAAARTPIGKAPRGVFKNVRPDDLLVYAIQAALSQVPNLDPKTIEDVIAGCAFPEAEQGLNMARMAALLAGLPNTVGGVTVNRYCASGITAVAMAADRIRVGESDVMIAAGAESMSMVPMMGHHPSMNMNIFKDENVGMAYGMGLTAEKVAQQWKISREEQDAFALASHQKALAAQQPGERQGEIVLIEVIEKFPNLESGQIDVKTRTVTQDEGVRADTSVEALAKLKPVFAAKGTVTAGNSSQTSDGAGALILVSEKILKQFNLTPLARFASFAVKGVPPEIMGIGPKEAIPVALKAAGITQDQLDWIELNEAFAAQSLAVMKDLGLDPAKVNPYGGAIALGHPLGATGGDSLGDGDPCLAQQEPEIRHGDDVRRYRHGRSRHLRAGIGCRRGGENVDVLIAKSDGILTIEFNRPEKKNAITFAMYEAMASALLDAQTDDAVRLILFTGKPEVFSAGNDLEDFLQNPPRDTDTPVYRFMRNLSRAEKPVVAAVAGNAVGIGTTMLLHCDLVYAADNAKFAMPFTKLGLCPEFASSLLLPRLAGYQRAAEKLLLGEPFHADEAYDMGLVNRVLPANELLSFARSQAAKLALLPASSLRETKRLMKAELSAPLDARIIEEMKVFADMLHSPQARQAFNAFLGR